MIYGVLPEFSTSSVVLYIYFSNMTILLIECKPAIVINLKPSSECCKSQIVCTEIGADHRCYQIAAANRSAPENNPKSSSAYTIYQQITSLPWRHVSGAWYRGLSDYAISPRPFSIGPSFPRKLYHHDHFFRRHLRRKYSPVIALVVAQLAPASVANYPRLFEYAQVQQVRRRVSFLFAVRGAVLMRKLSIRTNLATTGNID